MHLANSCHLQPSYCISSAGLLFSPLSPYALQVPAPPSVTNSSSQLGWGAADLAARVSRGCSSKAKAALRAEHGEQKWQQVAWVLWWASGAWGRRLTSAGQRRCLGPVSLTPGIRLGDSPCREDLNIDIFVGFARPVVISSLCSCTTANHPSLGKAGWGLFSNPGAVLWSTPCSYQGKRQLTRTV